MQAAWSEVGVPLRIHPDLGLQALVLSTPHVGQATAIGAQRGLAVEVDRQLEELRDLLAESACQVHALLEPRGAERHEGDDVNRPDARVGTLVLLHVDQLQGASHGRGSGLHDRVRRTGEGDDAAVVRLVTRVVEQRHPVDLAHGADDLLDHLGTATLGEVRDAFDQVGHGADDDRPRR